MIVDDLFENVAGPERCWPGYRKVGTKPGTGRNAGKRVNDCEKIGESAGELRIGDPVIITGDVEFRGKTGDVQDFNQDGSFVVVDLYNYGPRSFHASDVSRNDYADSEDADDVAEAGNKPVDKQFPLGTGDTRTARELKTQMQGASDEFVKHAAKDVGPFHSRVAKMQGKLAKSELRRRGQGVAEGVPQPGPSSGAPKQFGSDAKIQTRQMTVKDIISSVPGVPYYNNVVDDWDAKDYSWGVTKKVIEYATYLKDHPESLAKLPPAIVLNGKFEDGAHRVSAIWLLQQRMDPKNPLWKNAKLNVQFVKQGVAEGEGGFDIEDMVMDQYRNGNDVWEIAQYLGIGEDEVQDIIDSNEKGVAEADAEKIGGRYDPEEFDDMMLRLKTLAGAGPLKTVWDPERRVYRNVPINQPKDQK